MSDGWTDIGTDYCSQHDCRPTAWKLVIRLVIMYAILATMSLCESRFRSRGIELEARVETVGAAPKGGLLVRYHFRDPVSGLPRMNTVTVPKNLAPQGPTAPIEYIPGEYPTSRLKSQAKPVITTVFFWLNAILLAGIAGVIGFIVWEGHRPIRRSSERRCPPLKVTGTHRKRR
jgi:hypothetical protein